MEGLHGIIFYTFYIIGEALTWGRSLALLKQGQYWKFDATTASLSCMIVSVIIVGVTVVVSVVVTDVVVGVAVVPCGIVVVVGVVTVVGAVVCAVIGVGDVFIDSAIALRGICNDIDAQHDSDKAACLLSFSLSPDVQHVDCKTLQSAINAESHYKCVGRLLDSFTLLFSSYLPYLQRRKFVTSQRRTG